MLTGANHELLGRRYLALPARHFLGIRHEDKHTRQFFDGGRLGSDVAIRGRFGPFLLALPGTRGKRVQICVLLGLRKDLVEG